MFAYTPVVAVAICAAKRCGHLWLKLASTKDVLKTFVVPEGIPFRINGQVNQMDIAAGQRVVQPLEDLYILMQPGIDKGKGVWRYVLLLRTLLQARKRGERLVFAPPDAGLGIRGNGNRL